MKNIYIIFAVIGFFAGAVLTSCNIDREKKVEDAKEKAHQANKELKDAQAKYDKEWQQFKSDAEFRIRTNENRINEFKTEIQTASGTFKTKYQKEVFSLEQKNIELKTKIREYKYEGKDKWEEFKKGFNHDMDVVGETLHDLFSKKE